LKRVKRVAFGFTNFENYAEPRIMPMQFTDLWPGSRFSVGVSA